MVLRIIKCSRLICGSAGLGPYAPDNLGSQITHSNLSSQRATHPKVLINVIRVSRDQAVNFIAAVRVDDSQTETLSKGLRTIAFGSAQTAANNQAIVRREFNYQRLTRTVSKQTAGI
jgi:hypothetical protein